MARPENWSDLSKDDRRGDQIANWSGYTVMAHPSIAKHLVAASEAALKAGLIVDNDGIYERPTDQTLEERLVRAQARWDELENQYNIAVDFGVSKNDLWSVNNWARENGKPILKAREEQPAF